MNQPAAAFYVTSGPVPESALCYVERKADAELRAALEQGNPCFVQAPQGTGKTSLARRAAAHLREAGRAVAFLDLGSVEQDRSAEQWYRALVSSLGEQLGVQSELLGFWDRALTWDPGQRWLAVFRDVLLAHLPGPVVVFVDALEAVQGLPFPVDGFFLGIRDSFVRRSEQPVLRRLTFCLLSSAPPSELISRIGTLSPFTLGTRIDLPDFAPEDASLLAAGLGREAPEAKAILDRVLYWTSGHPYLTHRLLHAVAANGSSLREVDGLCETLFFGGRMRARDPNLLFVASRLHRADLDRTALLELYLDVLKGRRPPYNEGDPLAVALDSSGLVRCAEGGMRPRSRLYSRIFDARWVKANLPADEARRRDQAFRRGSLSAAVVGGLLLALVAGTASLRIRGLQEQAARLQAQGSPAALRKAVEERDAERARVAALTRELEAERGVSRRARAWAERLRQRLLIARGQNPSAAAGARPASGSPAPARGAAAPRTSQTGRPAGASPSAPTGTAPSGSAPLVRPGGAVPSPTALRSPTAAQPAQAQRPRASGQAGRASGVTSRSAARRTGQSTVRRRVTRPRRTPVRRVRTRPRPARQPAAGTRPGATGAGASQTPPRAAPTVSPPPRPDDGLGAPQSSSPTGAQ